MILARSNIFMMARPSYCSWRRSCEGGRREGEGRREGGEEERRKKEKKMRKGRKARWNRGTKKV